MPSGCANLPFAPSLLHSFRQSCLDSSSAAPLRRWQFDGDRTMKRLLHASMLVLALALAGAPIGHAAEPSGAAANKGRVVMQVSDADPAKWNLALNNANNLQKDLGAAN